MTFTDEQRNFLTTEAHTGKLATVRQDGRPHVVPIWFDLDGDTIVFTTGDTSVKARNIKHDPRVSFCVDDEKPPFSFMQIDGIATLSDDKTALLHWATSVGGKYMGADKAEIYGKRNAVEGELVVRITPTKVIIVQDLAD